MLARPSPPALEAESPQRVVAPCLNSPVYVPARPTAIHNVLSGGRQGAPAHFTAPPPLASPSARCLPKAVVSGSFDMMTCPPPAASPSARRVIGGPVPAGYFEAVSCPAPLASPSAVLVARGGAAGATQRPASAASMLQNVDGRVGVRCPLPAESPSARLIHMPAASAKGQAQSGMFSMFRRSL
eukprot:TRINITY_DN112097_c0_g1_i1.p1 TRINITY_DN112097_c0_g1~~TRINITY_DN112097_c0_g1_i1.p1  ORF type:complete len:210 (-),score=17.52 TRINITY_DN112097_c0_g1_i1:83-634(-)